MPINATQRGFISNLVAGVSSYEEDTKTNFNLETILVGGTAAIGAIGIPVIYNEATEVFNVYVAQSISGAITAGGSPLPDGSVVGVLVGDRFGFGFDKQDVTLTADGVPMTVLYRGDATILNSGMVWGTADATAQAAFLAQLEQQRITTIETATVVTPTYL